MFAALFLPAPDDLRLKFRVRDAHGDLVRALRVGGPTMAVGEQLEPPEAAWSVLLRDGQSLGEPMWDPVMRGLQCYRVGELVLENAGEIVSGQMSK